MTAYDFPITQPYGYDPSYPLNNGFHNGVDFGCPSGTPVVVNNVLIGYSGNTGYSTGPHCHVGRWVGGTVTNPGSPQDCFTVSGGRVTQVDQDATNGKFVRIADVDGSNKVYLHLSDNTEVRVGDVLANLPKYKEEEENMNPKREEVINAYQEYHGRSATESEIDVYVNKPWTAPDGLLYGMIFPETKKLIEAASPRPINKGDVLNWITDNTK